MSQHTQDPGLRAALKPDHEFKSHPDVFWPAARGEKTFEFRKDDRGGFHVGQIVRLRCYDPNHGYNIGRPPLDRRITNILRGGEFGLQEGYCILSLAPLAPAHAPGKAGDREGLGAAIWRAELIVRLQMIASWAVLKEIGEGDDIRTIVLEAADYLAALAPSPTGNEAPRGAEDTGRLRSSDQLRILAGYHSDKLPAGIGQELCDLADEWDDQVDELRFAALPPPVSPQPDSSAHAPSGAEREAKAEQRGLAQGWEAAALAADDMARDHLIPADMKDMARAVARHLRSRAGARFRASLAPAVSGSGEPDSRAVASAWRPMKDAPTDGKTQIVARHQPNGETPHGWIATITIDFDDPDECRRGGLDTIVHYNGDRLMSGFHGMWAGWMYPEELATLSSAPTASEAAAPVGEVSGYAERTPITIGTSTMPPSPVGSPQPETGQGDAGDGWLPMETAPKDGSVILVTREHEKGGRWVEASAWRRDTYGAYHWGRHGEYERHWSPAVSWRPLPSPALATPTTATTAEGTSLSGEDETVPCSWCGGDGHSLDRESEGRCGHCDGTGVEALPPAPADEAGGRS